jgi:ribosomal protein S18 acetylase RimI-like enzyme
MPAISHAWHSYPGTDTCSASTSRPGSSKLAARRTRFCGAFHLGMFTRLALSTGMAGVTLGVFGVAMPIRAVVPEDHHALLALWQRTPGIVVRDEDAFEPFCAYLRRNPELSMLSEIEGRIAGCLLAGHDGRRGYLHHLVVDEPWRGQGIARALLDDVLRRLQVQRIRKVHVFVLRDAPQALSFWRHQQAWGVREDIEVISTRGEI